MFLMYGGGITAMYGALAAFSMLSGVKFEFGGDNGRGGVPLPSSVPAVAVLFVAALGLYGLGARWDAPRFASVRARHRWLVPVVTTFVVVPSLVMLLFVMVR